MFKFRKTMFSTSSKNGKKEQQSHHLSLRLKQVQNIYYFLNKPFLLLREKQIDEKYISTIIIEKKQAKINYFIQLS
ncbi:hypothetical protein TTHERM_001388165 (macronuclear) [Tetrahymena thermophila SB210]|uniref:Uncharacterized protein n=1 Tax=Tetrahymena thermophila (strain SB210) TaxID=312017 RepID=W7XGD0_TETTS|nr:hypothetical protein TTHERM_001388165 [Tetrahymena thermophila SB210]EWS71934.1 hypothetical protein TTHERM_001388165 [Tetrahymena thermophila SB210]|eukprot:XP_012655535.1 hypothetical protein TTHERM_001388165 [Tetrahymena thermophila SB210]